MPRKALPPEGAWCWGIFLVVVQNILLAQDVPNVSRQNSRARPQELPHLAFVSLASEKDLAKSEHIAYGVRLTARPGRSLADGKRLFQQGRYHQASEVIVENRYTEPAANDPYYFNWLLKSLLAARRLELIPRYLRQPHLQPQVLRQSTHQRAAELYYLIGRYYFAIGELRRAREIFVDYLYQFPGSFYEPSSYYWLARSLERDNYLEEARAVYLLVGSHYLEHQLNDLAKHKAGVISLRLLKQEAEEFLRSRGVVWKR